MSCNPNDPLTNPACFSLTLCGDGMMGDEIKALIESEFLDLKVLSLLLEIISANSRDKRQLLCL